MATSHSPSSPDPIYSTAVVAVQPPASKSSSRRLPPPCWSDDETVALITVYREKWYSLRRGNLRAPDWQDVADGVAVRCPLSNPAKTSIQCRHKMEKLRKRYRSEIQRIGNNRKGYGCPSSWIHFKLMDSMELGLSRSDPSVDLNNNNNNNFQNDDVADEDEDEDDLMVYHPKRVKQATNRRYPGSGSGLVAPGVRIKIPNFSRSFDDLPPSMNREYGSRNGLRNGNGGGLNMNMNLNLNLKRKNDGGENLMSEMVAAIQKLGDRFVKMERMKMDMARELESMRMKAEMKQTEMILETHQKLWNSFSESVSEKKKMKRVPTPEEG